MGACPSSRHGHAAGRRAGRLPPRRRGAVLSRIGSVLRRQPADVGRGGALRRGRRCARPRRGARRRPPVDPLDIHRRLRRPDARLRPAFRPTSGRVRPRWERIALATRRGEAFPPIEVYRVGDAHFVRDGHHRVSVARAHGRTRSTPTSSRSSRAWARTAHPHRRPAAQEPRAAVLGAGAAADRRARPHPPERPVALRRAGRGRGGLGLPHHAGRAPVPRARPGRAALVPRGAAARRSSCSEAAGLIRKRRDEGGRLRAPDVPSATGSCAPRSGPTRSSTGCAGGSARSRRQVLGCSSAPASASISSTTCSSASRSRYADCSSSGRS